MTKKCINKSFSVITKNLNQEILTENFNSESCVSLLKQIEEEKDKGYSDKEIVNAVIKAITS